MSTAILIDGSYFLRRYFRIKHERDPKVVVRDLFSWSLGHLDDRDNGRRELYRIFFYDCPPLEKKAHNPVTKHA